ncbi:hypothetical protein ACFQ1S_00010 [Kibdelosporangium lantanae]|uniref:Uncharacterized protein n=1 Tax=Kibdelosporangium lantanae TaxID=1497396 RepID=A0ABW3M2H8_9PSEU
MIAAAAALIGAGVGGTATYLTAASQYKRQAKKETDTARRAQEGRAAKECEELCGRIAHEMDTQTHSKSPAERAAEQARNERIRQAQVQFDTASLYLPEDVRLRLEPMCEIISESEALGHGTYSGGPTHFHSPRHIRATVAREVRTLVAAFLQNEPLPPPSRNTVEYSAALTDLRVEQKAYYEDQDHPDQNKAFGSARTDFYRKHPDLLETAQPQET